MKSLLRIFSVCLCMLVFTHIQAIPPPTQPVLNQIDVFNGSSTIPVTTALTNVPINTTVTLYFDQKVFNIGGTAFNGGDNVASFITFSGGITFTATIDPSGKIITIVPTQSPQQLISNTTYTVGILANKFQNAVADPNIAQTVDFTTADAVALNGTVPPAVSPLTVIVPRTGNVTIPNIVITEGSSASFGEGSNQTFVLTAPTGFNFVAGIGSATNVGADVSASTLTVTTTTITLQYTVSSTYADINSITITGVQVVWVGTPTTGLLKRIGTGGTAVQAANRVASDRVHATFTVLPELATIDLFNLPVTILPLASALTNIPINTTVILDFSEPIFNTSAVAFTNTTIDAIFTFKETISGTLVGGYNATTSGQTVTITSSELKANTSYTIELLVNSCQNAATTRNAAQTVAFTTAGATTTSLPTLELCQNGAAEILGNIVITEGSSASFGQGNNQIMEIAAPTGYQFIAGTGNVTISGLDISNANLFVSATKITLYYDITNYFGTDVITIDNLQVKSTTLSNGTFLRTGGNAIQAGNRVADNFSLATLTSVAAPTAPMASIITTTSVCSGFAINSVVGNISAATLGTNTITFYDALTNVAFSPSVTAGNILASDLGYTLSNNTILGSKQFYMTFTSASLCESAKTYFSITINPNPTVYITAGAASLCAGNQTTFAITGTVGATNVLEVKFNAGAFSAASAYGSTTTVFGVTYFTTFSTLMAGNYQLKATSTLVGCPDTDLVSFVVKPAPIVTFVWGANPLSYLSTVPFVDLTDGITFGGAVNAVVSGTTVGTYSGTAVSGTKFYPGIAPIGVPITITYSYTDIATGCSDSASIVVTVTLIGSITNPVNNLAVSYCQTDPISGILTPTGAVIAQGTGIPAPVIPMAPFLSNPPAAPYDPYFNFYNSASEGFIWDGTNYRFNPAAVFIPTGNSSVTINVRMNAWLPFRYYFTSVTVFRSPELDMNLVDNTIFCTANANTLITPTLSGFPNSGIVMEYKLQSQTAASYAVLPGGIPNTIVPSLFGVGDYDLRISYTQTVAPFCSNTLVRKFRIKANPMPTMSVENSFSVPILSGGKACVGSSINFITTASFVGGTYTISKLSGGIVTSGAITTSVSITLPTIPDVYTITLSYTDNYPTPFPSGNCTGVSAPYVVNIIANPTPSFTFASAATTLALCEGVNNFTLFPVAQAIPGTGSYNIKKVGLVSAGGNFSTNTFNIATDFNSFTGTGAGDYAITYTYTYNAANGGCIGTSSPLILRINPKPVIDFVFSTSEICNSPTKTIITVAPSLNGIFGAITPASGKLRIYDVSNTLLLPVTAGVFDINLNIAAFNLVSSQINPLAITEFKVEFEYQDANTCINITTPRKSFYVNPLPLPTISFASVSDFCKGDITSATFTVNATGGTVGVFDGTRGFITIRPNGASVPATVGTNTPLLSNINTFVPSTLGVGEYFIDYTYNDSKNCAVTVTCATLLRLRFNDKPTFTFPSALTNYAICPDVTSLALTPALPSANGYGKDASLVNSRGTYTFTKGAFTATFSGTTLGTTDTFNPLTLLVNAVGGGIGTYDVKYTYTSLLTCVNTSLSLQQLTINPSPGVNFALSATEICNTPIKSIITLTPTLVSGTIIPADGFIRIYASDGTTLLVTMPNGTSTTNTINLNDPLFASLVATISPTAITTFKVEYRYIGANSCIGVSAQQSLFINPLPVPTIVSTGTANFCFGDGNSATFTLGATGVYTTPFVPAGVITVRNNTATVAYSYQLVAGDFTLVGTTLSFNPSALAGIVPGEYLVDYKYTNTKTCAQTVTSATIIKIRDKTIPTFRFANGLSNTSICAVTTPSIATNLVLTPSLPTAVVYGADATIVNSRGTYTFTKPGYTASFTGTVIGLTDTFDPVALLVNAPNGGAGIYAVTYTYTSAFGCVGVSVAGQLTINELPDLTFLLSNNNICNYGANQTVTLTPTWVNQGVNTFDPNNGRINIYNSANARISLPSGDNIISRDYIGSLFTISTTAVTIFDIEYQYLDVNGCRNVSPRQPLYINPLPVPTISFTSALPAASNFCFGSGGVASFTLNAIGVGVSPFNLANGFITIRSSSPTGTTIVLPNGDTSFNVAAPLLAAPALPVGEYFIDYTYTDTKTCLVKVICATTLKINAVPLVSFNFLPTNVSSYGICENVTTLSFSPVLTNPTAFGVDASLNVASGEYIITKGAFIWSVPSTNTFNPKTKLFDDVNGGAGVYTVVYRYRTAVGCDGFSSGVQTLTIYLLPAPTFTFVGDNSFCENELNVSVIPQLNSAAPPSPGNGFFTITKTAPIAGLPAIQSNGLNQFSIATLITNSGLGTYNIFYTYLDVTGCTNTTVPQAFTIIPLPVTSLSFPSGDNSFCENENTATVNITYAGVINPLTSLITIKKGTFSYPLAAGINTFDPSILANNAAAGVGTYDITHTYTDLNSCTQTTLAITFNIYALPAPTLAFQTASFPQPTLSVCANATSVTLIPGISNPGIAGGVGAFSNALGYFTINKGGTLVTQLPNGINTFNPNDVSLGLTTSAGGIVGDYEILYTYRTANGCSKTTLTGNNFRINPLPVLSFTLSNDNMCNYVPDQTVTLTPTWVNQGANTFVSGNGKINIYNAANSQISVPNGQNIISKNFIVASFTISATAITTFQIEYEYVDANGCSNKSPRQPLYINPLPVPIVAFSGASSFCLGDGGVAGFTLNATGTGVTPFNLANGFITIRNNPLSAPATLFYNKVLANGVTSFNTSTLSPALLVGEYFIDYTYTDAKTCLMTTTCTVLLKINAVPAVSFKFPGNADNYAICEDVTTLTLVPTLSNTTAYGVEATLATIRGEYIFTKGAFSVTLTNSNTFNPQTFLVNAVGGGVGTYQVVYKYRTALGCDGFSTTIVPLQELIINPLPEALFTFTAGTVGSINPAGDVARICANFVNDVTLTLDPTIVGVGSYSFEIVEIAGSVSTVITNNSSISSTLLGISPFTTVVRRFQITLRYTNVNGCVDFSIPKILEVVPLPATTFTVGAQRCFGIPVTFDGTSVTQATDLVVSYQWNFNDGSTTANVTTTGPTTAHIFVAAGSYPVSLTITTALGCSKTYTTNVVIATFPVANFTTATFCEGSSTAFTSTSTVAGGTIDMYAWNFGDGTSIVSSSSPTITHLFPAPRKYNVTLTVTTNSLCTDVFTKEVFIFPRITPTAAVPYKENFDATTDPNTWFANGLIKANLNPLIDTIGFSWKRGVPTGLKIKATNTNGGAWSTTSGRANTIGGLDSTFYPNERSYVESPCFNFSDPTLTKPMISMKVWYDTDRGSDGAVLYSSINDGVTWEAVGTINEGIEWYNTAGIIALPGGQSVVNAWTGNTFTEYKVAKFNLDQFKGLPSVRFRVAFGSNADNPVGTAFDGFAFDDVFIGNRNRISLLEHFTNASSSEANTENTFINNFPTTTAQNEIYNIQYHTNVPGADPMNADNTAVPSARALFYGVSQVPRTAIDGAIENRKFSEWGTPVYNKRTLEASPFELSVDFSSTAQQLRFKANVKALEPFTRRVILQTVVIEQEILGTAFTGGNFGGLTFKNVVKGMIPNASGTLIAQTWLQNTQFQTGELVWANIPKIYNGNKLVLVVFVQDEVTKEIYQAGFFNITTNISAQDPTTALDPQTLENEFVVYPNPAQNEVFTGFRDETAEDFKVVIFDSYGKRLDTFSLTKGNKGLLLNTEKYASGMYFVEITGKNNIKARRKLVIAR